MGTLIPFQKAIPHMLCTDALFGSLLWWHTKMWKFQNRCMHKLKGKKC